MQRTHNRLQILRVLFIACLRCGVVGAASTHTGNTFEVLPLVSPRQDDLSARKNQNTRFSPCIIAIPGSGLNSSILLVSASGIGEQPSPVYVSADHGPTSRKHSHTMEFDGATEVY